MIIKQIIEFELRGLGSLVVHVLLKLVSFVTKQKSPRQIFEELLITAEKYCRRQCTLLPLIWAKSLTKFNPKMQDFKGVLDLAC